MQQLFRFFLGLFHSGLGQLVEISPQGAQGIVFRGDLRMGAETHATKESNRRAPSLDGMLQEKAADQQGEQ